MCPLERSHLGSPPATPDRVMNAYVPALAAEELGVYGEEGLEGYIERLPSLDTVNARRDGAVDFETIGFTGGFAPCHRGQR